MQLLITRPVALTGDGGMRVFVPGLAVEVDAASAERILALQAGVVRSRAVDAVQSKRARKPTNDHTRA